MNFDVVLFIWLLFCSGSTTDVQPLPCKSLDVDLIKIADRCYWVADGGTLLEGERTCEENNGTVFSVQAVDDIQEIKQQLNISEATELFLGAVFHDVNGTQFYNWLSDPGTKSELLTNLTEAGMGNQSKECLSYLDEVKDIRCDLKMNVTICMRDITADCPCINETNLNKSTYITTRTSKHYGGNTVYVLNTTVLQNSSTISITATVTSTVNSSTETKTDSSSRVTSKGSRATSTEAPVTSITPQANSTSSPTTHTPSSTTSSPSPTTSTPSSTTSSPSPTTSTPSGTTSSPSPTTSTPSSATSTDARSPSTESHAAVSEPPITQRDEKKTTVHQSNNSDLNSLDMPCVDDNSSMKLNYSEKIDNVPGKNRSMTVEEIFNFVVSNTKPTNKSEGDSSTPSLTPLCNDDEDFSDVGEHLGDMLFIKNRLTNFSNILNHVVSHGHSNSPKKPCRPVRHAVTGLNGTDPSNRTMRNMSDGFPATDVKFQVSGLNSQVPPWPGNPYFVAGADGPSSQIFGILQNTSRVFNELEKETEVTNNTIQRFAGTVNQAVTATDIDKVPENMKETLLTDIFKTAEKLVAQLKSPYQDLHVETETLIVNSKLMEVQENSTTNHTYVVVNDDDRHFLKLSEAIFDHNSVTRVSTIEYKNLESILPLSNSPVSSHVMSVSVQRVIGNCTRRVDVDQTEGAIVLVLETFIDQEKLEDSRLCTFWDFEARNWSTNGCHFLDINATHTTCTCNHLTNFAVLVMYMEMKEVSLETQQALLTLTTVGCSLSIACLAMTLIAFAYLRMLSNEKILIHFNLSLALMLAQIVFVSSSDAHTNPAACKVVAILLHFFFMAAFTWMLVEGVALYLLCTKGFIKHRDMRIKYFLLGWGVPAVIVTVSLAAQFPSYGHGPQYSCWLSVQNGLIWAFLGPMLAIVVLNMFVMGLVVRKFLTLKAVARKTEVAKLRGSLRAMMTLLPLLGLTWLLSLLVPFSVVFHYFFVIINTLQGMCIFFLHCICNDELRKKFQAKRRRWSSPTRTGSDTDTRYTARRKTGSFDEIVAVLKPTETATKKYAWA